MDDDYDDDGISIRTVARNPFAEEDVKEEEEEVVENEVEEESIAKKLEARRPKYFFQNGFFYHRNPPSFYNHPYGHFQRYHSYPSFPYTYSYYLG